MCRFSSLAFMPPHINCQCRGRRKEARKSRENYRQALNEQIKAEKGIIKASPEKENQIAAALSAFPASNFHQSIQMRMF
jgi:hypothetical protein